MMETKIPWLVFLLKLQLSLLMVFFLIFTTNFSNVTFKANDIFSHLVGTVQSTTTRISNVAATVERVQQQVPQLEAHLQVHSLFLFYLTLQENEPSNIAL